MIIHCLGKYIDQIRGVTYRSIDSSPIPLNGYLPILRSNNIEEGSINFIDLVFVPKERINDVQLLKKGDILITASTGSLKVIGKNGQIESDYNGAFGAFCKVVRPKTSIYAKYLKFYFQTNNYRTTIRNVINGANINNIKNEHIDNLKIPLPPLKTQRKIAALLDKANELVQNDKKTLKKYDQLAQSVFLEMFGDPIKNTKRFIIKRLDQLASISRGKFTPRPRNDPKYYNGSFPFIQTGDIANSKHRLTNYTQTLNENGIKVSKEFKKGTVVVAIVGATIGTSAILEIDTYATDSVIGIIVNQDIASSEYIEYVLRFWKPIFLERAPETARANINIETFKPIEIPLPPMELQRRYLIIINHIETQKQLVRQSLQKSEELFQGLMQRAFKGELTTTTIRESKK
jgi:type I restriction enzyme S subunit